MKRLRRNKSARIEPERICDEEGNLLDRCLICMECIQPSMRRGVLECGHNSFCYICITDWAEVTNKCPLCAVRFYQVLQENTGVATAVSDKDQPVPEVGDPFLIETRCVLCACDTDEATMLLCDRCDNGFHTACLGLSGIPLLEEWFCDDCFLEVSSYKQREQLKVLEQMSKDQTEIREPPRRKRLRKGSPGRRRRRS